MKKTGVLLFLLSFSSLVMAWEMPPRFFEVAFDAEFGADNSYLSLGDFFNAAQTLALDFDSLGSREFSLDFAAKGNFALNVQARGKHWIGVGLYTGFDTLGFFAIPEDAMGFLFRGGNLSNLEGGLELGGSVFADTGLKTSFRAGKFRFAVSPALYIPVLYMPRPDITYRVTSTNPLKGVLHADAVAYTAVPVNDDFLNSPSFTADDASNMPRGVDLSVDVSYGLFSFLDVGGSVSHIPLYPAYMQYGARVDKTYVINENELDLNDLLDGGLGGIISPEPSEDDLEYFSGAHKAVFRPLRFAAYAFYKPFKKDWLALRPWIGFSALTVYDSACFNFGLDFQLKLVNMLNFHYAFSLMEKVWQNKLAIGLNLRLLELDVGAGFRSREFTGAFTVKGFYASVGMRLGF
ncbi:MAG: hypothetical protein LBS48_02810 [Treponema sp.]|jgi:hypothetical protein|nr:hypothetical protein [Treponema sp.]